MPNHLDAQSRPCQTHTHATRISALAIAFIILQTSMAKSDGTITECYGSHVSIIMNVGDFARNNNGEVVFNLPNPEQWSIPAPPIHGNLVKSKCHMEPIYANSVRSLPYRTTIPLRNNAFLRKESGIVSISLYANMNKEVDELLEKKIRSRINWVDIGDGFMSSNHDATQGNILSSIGHHFIASLPKEHTSPLGELIYAKCTSAGECTIEYYLSQKFKINYTFFLSEIPFDNWVEFDKNIRSFIYDSIDQ